MKNTDESNYITMEGYQLLAARTINSDLDENQTLKHGLFGLASEAGEVLGLFQKMYQGHDIDPDKLKKELGDVLWMIAEICTSLNYSLGEIANLNIDKLRKRYPDGFSAERSIYRDEEESSHADNR